MFPRLVLLVAVVLLVLIGIVMVFSASTVEAITNGEAAWSYVLKQFAFSTIGAAIAIIFFKMSYEALFSERFILIYWGLCVLALLAVAFAGTEILGAKRWLYIGPVSIQPAEFAKIACLAVGVNVVLAFKYEKVSAKRAIGVLLVCLAAPMMIILFGESDLGTVAIIILGLIAVVYMAGIKTRYILIVFGCLAAIVVIMLLANSSGYRMQRIMVWLDPWSDEYGKGYQMIRSFYAFAEGGLFGVGLGNSREKFLYLPEAETDFIFSIIGEELGLVGTLVVVGLFTAILWAGLKIAKQAVDEQGRLMAGGLTVMLVGQAFLNMGCALGIFPTTGKPLPFVSSGGSSVVTSLMIVGIIMAVSRRSGDTTSSLNRAAQRRRENLDFLQYENGASSSRRAGSRGGGSFSRNPAVDVSRRRNPTSSSSSSRRNGRGDAFGGIMSPGSNPTKTRDSSLRLSGSGRRSDGERNRR